MGGWGVSLNLSVNPAKVHILHPEVEIRHKTIILIKCSHNSQDKVNTV